MAYQKFCGTPPLNLLMGLEAGLGLLFREGVDAVHARHRLLAGAVQAAVQAWSSEGALDFFCSVPAARSVSVTAVRTARASTPMRCALWRVNVSRSASPAAWGRWAGRVFRIGHLGDLNAPMILGALAGVEAAMLSLGIPFGRDGVQRAVERDIARARPRSPAPGRCRSARCRSAPGRRRRRAWRARRRRSSRRPRR
jgi:alanine-glyoxylate transaminase/serine-glyoxylate transaminase/serine-pyruvate transaminase